MGLQSLKNKTTAMIHTQSILWILLLALMVMACSEKEGPDPMVLFTLIIENTTTRSVDVYIKPQLQADEEFVLAGTAFSGEDLPVEELITKEPYLVRLVNSGRPVSEFFQERAIANVNAEVEEIRLKVED